MTLSSFIEKVLHGEYDFCGLCFKTVDDERADMNDEVILQERDTQKAFSISELLSYVLGEDVFAEISVFQTICLQCVTTAVNSYKFMKIAKDNVVYLSAAIETLHHCLNEDEIPENLSECDTLFVTISPADLNIGAQYYNNIGPIYTKKQAFEKFQSILNTGIPKKEKKSLERGAKLDLKYKNEKPNQKEKKSVISTVDMVHNGDMSALICKECFKGFQCVANLRSHFLRMHAPKEFQCSECSKSFGTKSLLKSHTEESHINLVCSECGKTFTNLQTFKLHEKTHYMRIVCPDCGRVYKNPNTFKKHIINEVCQTPVRHSPADAKFTCDYCNKKYTQKISLRVHIQYEHLNYKYLECKWCKKKFWCQARLKAHIVKHTKEKKFLCTICSGKFVTKESLLYHTRIHTGERPYPCPFCDSRFLSASRRQAHIKSQHTDPTIECDICHCKFKSVAYLIKHKAIHMKSKPDNEVITSDLQENDLIVSKDDNITTYKAESNLDLIDIEEHDVVYNVIESDENVYEIQSVSNGAQETVYLELSENGDYNIKVTKNFET